MVALASLASNSGTVSVSSQDCRSGVSAAEHVGDSGSKVDALLCRAGVGQLRAFEDA